jgi:heme exporter protein A
MRPRAMNESVHASTPHAIETRGLSKSFGSHRALARVDLIVGHGECLTIFGPNGAGKTTLIELLATLSRPSAGSARVDGMDIRSHAFQVRRRLGVVTHSTFLYNELTVSENLRFYGRMYRVPNLEHRIEEVASQVHLESRFHDRVGTLSHGMQKRVSIARAVLHNPSIMLLDEPESGLDPHATLMMREILDTLNSGDRTVVMTTHNLERGLEIADHVAILHQGSIVYRAPKQEIEVAGFQEIYRQFTS